MPSHDLSYTHVLWYVVGEEWYMVTSKVYPIIRKRLVGLEEKEDMEYLPKVSYFVFNHA
jgi:hypothetical protein